MRGPQYLFGQGSGSSVVTVLLGLSGHHARGAACAIVRGPHKSMRFVVLLCWSITAAVAAAMLRGSAGLSAFAACLGLTYCLVGGRRTVTRTLALTLPFVLPLLFVHGVLNPRFSAPSVLFGFVPIRPDGAIFAIAI